MKLLLQLGYELLLSEMQKKWEGGHRLRFGDKKFEIYAKFYMSGSIKDVRANCLCASLLRTQFISQRHVTSCTSARAKEEFYSHEGMVTVAQTSLRFSSLGWSVTPTFFEQMIFFTNSRQIAKK